MKLPSAPEVEAAILGAIMKDPEVLAVAQEQLTASVFHAPYNRAIYETFVALADKDVLYSPPTPDKAIVVDLALILDGINQRDARKYFKNDPALYLAGVYDYFNREARHIPELMRVLKDRATLREFIEIADALREKACAVESPPVIDFITEADETLGAIFRRPINDELEHIGESIETTALAIGDRIGIATGLTNFDHFTGGLKRGVFMILAARASMGKTALGTQMLVHAARCGENVAIFSFESSIRAIEERLLSATAQVDLSAGRPTLTDEEKDRLFQASQELKALPIFIGDVPANLKGLRARIQNRVRSHNVSVVMIDYLQIIPATESKQPREQQVASISKGLARIAKDLNVALVVLAQLNRACDGRDDHRPMMSDLRESGQIEQDADLIAMLYRDKFYNPKADDKAELSIVKHRDGQTGLVLLTFLPQFVTFGNASFDRE